MDVKLQTLLIFGMMANISGWRPFSVKFLNKTYESVHPELMDLNLTIRNQSFINMYINIVRDIPQLFVDIEVARDSGNGTYDMTYMNKTVDVCMFLNNKKSNGVLDVFYRMLSVYGDLPKKCPIVKRMYQLLNVFIDPEQFPPFIPDLQVKASGVLWHKQKGKKSILLALRFDVVVERSYKNNAN